MQASQQPSATTTSTVQAAALTLESPDWMASLAKARQWGKTHLFCRFRARVSIACTQQNCVRVFKKEEKEKQIALRLEELPPPV